MTIAGELLKKSGSSGSYLPNNRYIIEFIGILTLDLRNNEKNRKLLNDMLEQGTDKLSFKKLSNLDTVWLVTTRKIDEKSNANKTILDFLQKCFEELKINDLSIAFSLNLNNFHSTIYHKMSSHLGVFENHIDYMLYDKYDFDIANHIEPVEPVIKNWNGKRFA